MYYYKTTALGDPAVTEGGVTLLPNSPNPFIEMTLLWFRIPEAADVTLSIIDSHGRVMHTRTCRYDKGENHIVLKRADIREPGIYLYRLDTPYGAATRRLVMY